ncbi:MAG: pyridoxamine 5'-phosphate oxidase family protein [Oscillospiraceae bacterium]|nr:pyridoxamine 5'-phosphate oxidase family protein [Oscillospiraceae bacterium]
MRRNDREITDIGLIGRILGECKTCRLAMVDNGHPYVVPLSYAYIMNEETLTLLFHSAKEGRKIRVLNENSAVCFEISKEGDPVIATDSPCSAGYYFTSVHGFGNAEFVDDVNEKRRALSLLMKQQANIDVNFTPSQADGVCIIKVVSTEFTGKMKPHPAV